jgi:hypothetical protein
MEGIGPQSHKVTEFRILGGNKSVSDSVTRWQMFSMTSVAKHFS